MKSLDPEATLALYAPAADAPAGNDRSLVLYVRQGAQGALLTGDLEARGIAALLGQPLTGPMSLLKLPHHGSRHSAAELLVETFHPDCAVASAGAGNRYGFPDPQVRATLSRAGIPLWHTDRDGSVRFVAGAARWRVGRWQKGLFR